MREMRQSIHAAVIVALLVPAGVSAAQQPAGSGGPVQAPSPSAAKPPALPAGVPLPAGYVIGPEDVLTVVFWREKDMSSDVAVRPDGRITLPLLNEIEASGRTPEQLRATITEAASRYIEDPTVSVVVKQINSRKVFITGQVPKPGPYMLNTPMSVLQLIAMAGGVTEFAKIKDILITREEQGRPVAIRFNYNDVRKGKNLKQNIELRPGDTVIVP
jgi:polysaccharide export outer membrane protein